MNVITIPFEQFQKLQHERHEARRDNAELLATADAYTHMQTRALRAESQIAALWKVLDACVRDPWDNERRDRARKLLKDTAAAAQAHDAAIRKAALEEAAKAIERMPGDDPENTYSHYNEALNDAAHYLRKLAEDAITEEGADK